MYKKTQNFYKKRLHWSQGLPIWTRGETVGKENVKMTFSASKTIKILKNLSGAVRNFSGCFVFNTVKNGTSKQNVVQNKHFTQTVPYKLKEAVYLLGMAGAITFIAPSCNTFNSDDYPPKPDPEPKFITQCNQNQALRNKVTDDEPMSSVTHTLFDLRTFRAFNKQK